MSSGIKNLPSFIIARNADSVKDFFEFLKSKIKNIFRRRRATFFLFSL
jgi:hypothetical protein